MKVNKNLALVVVFIIIEALFLKIFMYDLLPSKYFYDAFHILAVMNGSNITDKAYSYVATIFNHINILGLVNIQQWGYLISIIFVPLIIYYLLKEKKYDNSQYIFIIASVTLLLVYVFGLSKDIIQFVYFWAIYLIINAKKIDNLKKLIMICIVLLFEALFFRVYFAIMAMIIVTIYYIYLKHIKNVKLDKKKVIKILFISLAFFFLEVFLVQLVSYSNYDAILNARYSVNIWRENDPAANTIINDLLGKNNNYLIFIGNYLINAIRLLFPIELFLKGPKQIIFAIYQIYISVNILKSIKKINDNNCLWIITAISFLMISIIFEPDFGSFVRHESAFLLILLEIIKINTKGCKDEKN